ncbi:MAG TPA: tripartite tricarboxylate transporter substrate binding protein [Nocardioidaceae bacterium]|nr:tripartite tricarboxylate transporter substrate binding protein [Nocardioidaceae bacterium]
MKQPRTGRRRVATTAGALIAVCAAAAGCGAETGTTGGGGAATFDRPVELVAPFGPGGGSDQVARALGAAMEKEIDTDIPVINVPGATGSTGLTQMLSSRPGESMAVLIQDTLTTVAAGSAAFELDEVRAVCRAQSMPSALMVRKGTYSSWEELAAAAKQSPGQLKVATVGSNSVDDIVLAAAKETQGTSFRAVPFSEPSERYAALLGGSVDVLYEQLGDVRQYLDSGDFVPVVLLADEPVEGYEDVPTATDIGFPQEVVLPQFRGMVVNADAPDDTVNALSEACGTAVETPKFQDFQQQVFATADSYQSAEDFDAFLQEQYDLIDKQLKAYGMGN